MYMNFNLALHADGRSVYTPISTLQISLFMFSAVASFMSQYTKYHGLYTPSSSHMGFRQINLSVIFIHCFCDPGRSRTGDLRFRKPLLYPSELQSHRFNNVSYGFLIKGRIGPTTHVYTLF